MSKTKAPVAIPVSIEIWNGDKKIVEGGPLEAEGAVEIESVNPPARLLCKMGVHPGADAMACSMAFSVSARNEAILVPRTEWFDPQEALPHILGKLDLSTGELDIMRSGMIVERAVFPAANFSEETPEADVASEARVKLAVDMMNLLSEEERDEVLEEFRKTRDWAEVEDDDDRDYGDC